MEVMRYVVFGVSALADDVCSGAERLKQGLCGTRTGCWSDLPCFSGGDWCDGASIDIDNGSQEVGVFDCFQLNRCSIEPFLHELL